MTTYKELKGTNIQAVSSDPSNPIEGQVWYNTTDNVTKGRAATAAGAWSSGGNLNTARTTGASANAAPTYATGILAGGLGASGYTAITESYNGTSWTEVNDLNQARAYQVGVGTSTAALSIAGYYTGTTNTSLVESWNGTNWTEITDINGSQGQSAGGAGTSTAALNYGGYDYSIPGPSDKTEQWNGTNWT